jgi:N-acetylmuramoyl-L-alanine amidase
MILINPGHGNNTAGKRSPVWGDGSQLFEWEFNREVSRILSSMLNDVGIANKIIVTENEDILLPERVRRANEIYEADKSTFGIDIHGNAFDESERAEGWEIWTYKGESESDVIAEYIGQEAAMALTPLGFKMRFDMSDGDIDKESSFYILKHTLCPWALSENGFYTNEEECKYMMSHDGKWMFAKIHFNAIVKYMEDL